LRRRDLRQAILGVVLVLCEALELVPFPDEVPVVVVLIDECEAEARDLLLPQAVVHVVEVVRRRSAGHVSQLRSHVDP